MTDTDTPTWMQINLTCTSWQAAEQMAAADLRPTLRFLEAAGTLDSWWFVRKGDTWRLRLRPTTGGHDEVTATMTRLTGRLVRAGSVRSVRDTVYEPEVQAFGGPEAMIVAHSLFHADSRHLLDHLDDADNDLRRELSMVLAARLTTAAGQDWYEQGDIWAQVAAHRPDTNTPPQPPAALLTAVRTLLTAAGDADGSPLYAAPAWPAGFHTAGAQLAQLASQGRLSRGLRAVLAHHVLFTFNRHGVSAADQHRLASAAAHLVFQENFVPDATPTNPANPVTATTVSAVNTRTTPDHDAPDTTGLRHALADEIRGWKVFRSAPVEAAFRAVPRHLFLPGVDPVTAYQNKPVVTKRDDAGNSISSASSPMLVAAMLEQLDVQPGHRILEIGAATGFNAALLAHLAGAAGTVVTIELDPDLVTGARDNLTAAGHPDVTVICGDGALGYAAAGPYDRIIVTAEAWDITPAWWQQLAIGGRLVVPLRLHPSGLTRALGFTHTEPGLMVADTAEVCGFVPMRGSTEHTDGHVPLADDVTLKLDLTDYPTFPDPEALANTLAHPPVETWTGIQVRDDEPAQHLDLWLCTATDGHDMNFGRLSIEPSARTRGAVNPARRWGGATFYHGGTIAYLAARPVRDDLDELGVIAHGPDSTTVARHLTELLHQWATQRPSQPVITAHQINGTDDPALSVAAIWRTNSVLTVEWAETNTAAVS